jgi:hypothetical protein
VTEGGDQSDPNSADVVRSTRTALRCPEHAVAAWPFRVARSRGTPPVG